MESSPPKIFRYRLNETVRSVFHGAMTAFSRSQQNRETDPLNEQIDKILIVRATFRMGDSLLALPAIWAFRQRFPNARIDFLGAPIASELFQNLPLNHIYAITRRYPGSAVDYPLLLWRLRSIGYDLAVDVSCSQSTLGSFLVGLSGARFRIGLKGKRDQWFDVRIQKSGDLNKYRTLPHFLRSLGIECDSAVHSLALTASEKENSQRKLRSFFKADLRKRIVGVFIGGRKTRGKGWPVATFCEVITALHSEGLNVVVFAGPEERDRISYFRDELDRTVPIVHPPSVRNFAGMLSNCDLFLTCDSGPMHLAYTLGVRTVAIFQYANFDRWGPPAPYARIAYQPTGCSAEEVLRICREELSAPVPVRS